jgi:HPt (histidine-containing phosphotransfer) domain-containing protein
MISQIGVSRFLATCDYRLKGVNHMGNGNTNHAILDREVALEQIGGDEAMFEEFLTILLEEAAAELTTITQAITQQDANSIEHAAHSLKGGAASMGADRVREAACRLEMIGRSGNLSEAPQAAAILKREVELLQQHVGR